MKKYINTIILGIPIAASIYMVLLNLVMNQTELGSVSQKVLLTVALFAPAYVLIFFILKARRSKKKNEGSKNENTRNN